MTQAQKLATKYWEDFAIGDITVTGSVEVTAKHLEDFSVVTGENYPIHTDPEFAKNTPFGAAVASGPLIYSLACGLMVQSGIWGDGALALLGVDRIRFLAPVFPGDTIGTQIEIINKKSTSKPDRGVIMTAHEVTNQRGQVVATFESTEMVRRRP